MNQSTGGWIEDRILPQLRLISRLSPRLKLFKLLLEQQQWIKVLAAAAAAAATAATGLVVQWMMCLNTYQTIPGWLLSSYFHCMTSLACVVKCEDRHSYKPNNWLYNSMRSNELFSFYLTIKLWPKVWIITDLNQLAHSFILWVSHCVCHWLCLFELHNDFGYCCRNISHNPLLHIHPGHFSHLTYLQSL